MTEVFIYCEVCESRAIFTNYEGESRCVRCFPYRDVVDDTISDWSYSCHRCHKPMKPEDITPFQEWHICDKCMGEGETFK